MEGSVLVKEHLVLFHEGFDLGQVGLFLLSRIMEHSQHLIHKPSEFRVEHVQILLLLLQILYHFIVEVDIELFFLLISNLIYFELV